MKKLMLISALACGIAAFGAITPDPKDGTLTEEQIASEKGTLYQDTRVWPKTAPVAWKVRGFDVKFPVACSCYTKYLPKYDGTLSKAIEPMFKEMTLDELVGYLMERMDESDFATGNENKIVAAIMDKGFAAVRKYLKKQGKSFVTKDGVNPCEPYMKGLSDALNAPRLAGLEAWFTSVGVTIKVDTKYIPDDATINDHKDKIISGDENLTPHWQLVIRYGLGLEAYNKFVKEYNGEE